MTTGTEDARPQSEDQNTEPGNPGEGQQQTPLTVTEPVAFVDPDDAELEEAKTAAQAEEAAGQGENQDGAATGADPQQQQTTEPKGETQQGQQPEPVMIPKARFDEVLQRATTAEHAAAYYRGMAEARAQGQPQGQPQQAQTQPQQQATPEQRLADIQTQVDVLAKKFDDGEITFSELKRQERDLANQEQGIREELLLAKVSPQQAPQTQESLALAAHTDTLLEQHPWVQVYDQLGTDAEWAFLRDQAAQTLAAQGMQPSRGEHYRAALQSEVAQLMDRYGPVMLAERAQARGISIPQGQTAQPSQAQGQQQQQPTQRQMSPTAQQRQGKLAMMEAAPPNINALTGARDEAMPTESRIETMSDEDYDALPPATRDRLLGITAA